MNTNRSDEESLFSTGGTVPLPPDTIFERLRKAHEERVLRRRESRSNGESDSGRDVLGGGANEGWNQLSNEYTQTSEDIEKRNKPE